MKPSIENEGSNTDGETLLDLIQRIRDLEDFINDMLDKFMPGEVHFSTNILDSTLEDMKQSRELDRLNHLCNTFDAIAEGEDEFSIHSSNILITKKDSDDLQSLVFDLERCLLVLEMFWVNHHIGCIRETDLKRLLDMDVDSMTEEAM